VIIEDESFGYVLALEKTGDWLVNHFQKDGKLNLYDTVTGREVSVDAVFPVVHGTFCEDGTLQGLLELAMVPYVGADVTGSAIGMDKDVAKRLLRDAGIPVVPWKKYSSMEWLSNSNKIAEEISGEIGFPCFVKPCSAGSSVGISKVKNSGDLPAAMDEAFLWDNYVLVEKGIKAREVEFSVLGNDIPVVSIPGEIRPRHEFYSYEAKYIDSDGAVLIIPAEIDSEFSAEISNAALKGYKALNCCGMARIDFFVDEDSGDFYLNEINTIPGFTSISMYPRLWGESGISYPELLEKLIELALERREKKNKLRTDF
jgi:D-alanine-D-alanine ligase